MTTVEILTDLTDAGVACYALSNMEAETFPLRYERFAFFGLFDGIVISGLEGVAKPDPEIFELLLDRFGLDPRIHRIHRRQHREPRPRPPPSGCRPCTTSHRRACDALFGLWACCPGTAGKAGRSDPGPGRARSDRFRYTMGHGSRQICARRRRQETRHQDGGLPPHHAGRVLSATSTSGASCASWRSPGPRAARCRPSLHRLDQMLGACPARSGPKRSRRPFWPVPTRHPAVRCDGPPPARTVCAATDAAATGPGRSQSDHAGGHDGSRSAWCSDRPGDAEATGTTTDHIGPVVVGQDGAPPPGGRARRPDHS